MKVVIQRSKAAKVEIDNTIVGTISHGFVILVGFCIDDTIEIVQKIVRKIIGLRVFDDGDGKMNLNLESVGGQILSISQFTLYADCQKGNRPSFIQAARPDLAIPLYEAFNEQLRIAGIHVEAGVFGADMQVSLVNDGPVTICL
ncbi:MAG: D-aminoacyl-tRNA deacylase, partial [Culicoidibacterales bacterium]